MPNTSLIFSGGPIPNDATLELARAIKNVDLVIAADSGLHTVQKLDMHVDFVIGDFDSVDGFALPPAATAGAVARQCLATGIGCNGNIGATASDEQCRDNRPQAMQKTNCEHGSHSQGLKVDEMPGVSKTQSHTARERTRLGRSRPGAAGCAGCCRSTWTHSGLIMPSIAAWAWVKTLGSSEAAGKLCAAHWRPGWFHKT